MTTSARTSIGKVDYLFQGAVWQDQLLQSYRSVHLTLQSIFLAIGTVLSVSVFTSTESVPSVLSAAELCVLAALSVFILVKMRTVIIARGNDVTYWHCEIVRMEQQVPAAERYFTRFKIYQRTRRPNLPNVDEQLLSETGRDLTDDQIQLLVGRGLGHTRKVLDLWLFLGLLLMWAVLVGISLGFIVVHRPSEGHSLKSRAGTETEIPGLVHRSRANVASTRDTIQGGFRIRNGLSRAASRLKKLGFSP